MEGRNHSSAAFTAAGGMSRMKEDLLSCSQDLLMSFQPRAAIRGRGTTPKKPHIGVIGAGLAGLRCAEVLIGGGARVTILEARNRIGGRVYQSNLLDQSVDMGPNWVHGTDENPVFKIAQDTNTSLCPVAGTMHVFEPNGTIIPKDLAASGLETVWAFIEDAFRYSNEKYLDIGPGLSLKDYFHEKLAEGTLSQDQQARALLLAEMWGSFIGDSWERQSLRWFWLEECLDGGEACHSKSLVRKKVLTRRPFAYIPDGIKNLYVMESHASIIQHVAATPLAHADIHLLPCFAHFLHPEYVPEVQRHWPIEMVTLSSPAVFGAHAKPTLLIYTHDPCAEHISSLIRGLSPDSIEYFDVLERFFRPYYSRLPNYRPGHADCTPAAILATDWHGDDLAGNGSYTNFQVGEDTLGPMRTEAKNGKNAEKQQYRQIHLDHDIRAMRAGLPEREYGSLASTQRHSSLLGPRQAHTGAGRGLRCVSWLQTGS